MTTALDLDLDWQLVEETEAYRIYEAEPTRTFWRHWRKGMLSIIRHGIHVRKRGGRHVVVRHERKQIHADPEHVQASQSTHADMDPPHPQGLEYLPFQIAGIQYALQRDNVLLADDPGLGKTVQAIGVWNCTPDARTALIVCPATLRDNWRYEFRRWSTRPVDIHVVRGSKAIHWRNANVVILSYDLAASHAKRMRRRTWDVLICDEAHYLKNPRAKRTLAVIGRSNREAVKARRRLFLTGTPLTNRPIELWPLVRVLDPAGLGANKRDFTQRYCGPTATPWGVKYDGATNLDELQQLLRSRIMVRRTKQQVLPELPPKRRQIIQIEHDDQQLTEHAARYNELFDLITTTTTNTLCWRVCKLFDVPCDLRPDELAEQRRKTKVAFTELSIVRHKVASSKVPFIVSHLRMLLDTGPVVFFAHHTDVISAVADAFKGSLVLTGKTPDKDRFRIVQQFQNSKRNILFCGNIRAAGVGITLTRANTVVFGELDWVPANITQAEDRCHRIGQRDSVLVQHLVLKDSIDERIARILVEKQDVLDRVLDSNQQPPSLLMPKQQMNKYAANVDAELARTCLRGARLLARNNQFVTDADEYLCNRFRYMRNVTNKQAVLCWLLCRRHANVLPEDIRTYTKEHGPC